MEKKTDISTFPPFLFTRSLFWAIALFSSFQLGQEFVLFFRGPAWAGILNLLIPGVCAVAAFAILARKTWGRLLFTCFAIPYAVASAHMAAKGMSAVYHEPDTWEEIQPEWWMYAGSYTVMALLAAIPLYLLYRRKASREFFGRPHP